MLYIAEICLCFLTVLTVSVTAQTVQLHTDAVRLCCVTDRGNQILLFILGFLLFLGAALRVLSLICQVVNWMLD